MSAGVTSLAFGLNELNASPAFQRTNELSLFRASSNAGKATSLPPGRRRRRSTRLDTLAESVWRLFTRDQTVTFNTAIQRIPAATRIPKIQVTRFLIPFT